ncbi:MAG: hydrogenase formation protein HypD [Lachnospiraceae bacterium]|nr:hydrogenase formation protein HypD [Lachnospiraceae bacterium]
MQNESIEFLKNYDGETVNIMEVCGTHTHEIFRNGIRNILSPKINLISGPGCPVCVTPMTYMDEAIYLADNDVIVCTFGDLVRVPGSRKSLAVSKAEGKAVKTVYAPMDAVEIAENNPDREVVFLSVGFETTTPADCLAVKKAAALGLKNFSLLAANKTMPGAYKAMKDSTDMYLYPGHVHAITGTGICRELAEEGVSGVIAGFTPSELVTALALGVKGYIQNKTDSSSNKGFYMNCYPRVVRDEGSPKAVEMINEFMEECDANWRGIGVIPASGLCLRDKYADFDAKKKYNIPDMEPGSSRGCRCGDVLQGKIKPMECPLFGKVCVPDNPVGACMVSSEGACSAFYSYGGTLL